MAKKILVVDDSKTVRIQVSFTLSKAGFEVLEAEDGLEGLEKLKANDDVALIVSDISMPNLNGLELVRMIKAEAKYEKLPIIMLTTESSADSIGQAKKAGAKGFLVKPFNSDELIAAVQKLVA